MTLDQVHCIEQVIWITSSGSPFMTWTCSDGDCSTCEDHLEDQYCTDFILTVYTEGASLSGSECGDTLIIKRIKGDHRYTFTEIAIIGRQGEILARKMCVSCLQLYYYN